MRPGCRQALIPLLGCGCLLLLLGVLGATCAVRTTISRYDAFARLDLSESTVVAGSADLDGDGVDDFVVGSPIRGAVWAVSGWDGEVIWSRKGGGGFGKSVALGSDRNGDGTAEVLVGDVGRRRVLALDGRDGEMVSRTTAPADLEGAFG